MLSGTGILKGFSALRGTVLLVALPAVANAYIDPGSGSFLLQAALAGLLGLSFTLKSFWRSIRDRFRRDKDEDSSRR